MSKEDILITGARGFVGSNTAKSLEARSFVGDVRKQTDWEENLQGEEIIFLLAGIRTESEVDVEVNALGIESLFRAASRLHKLPKRLVLASSQAVCMGNKVPFKESDLPIPTTVYGDSKLLGEKTAERWCQELNIPLVTLRYSTVLGSGIREKSKMSGPLFAWTKAALQGEPVKVFQDGNQSRDYIHINDVVSANLMAVSLDPGIYNVGGGVSVKVIEVATWIKEAARSNSQIVVMGGEPNESDPREMISDITKLVSYGWSPEMTAKQAVDEFVKLIKFPT